MKRRIFSILLTLVLALSFSLATAVPAAAVTIPNTIEVSQPTQITSDSHYERGQSIVYDGTNYWLFWGQHTSFTGNYDSGNPDDSSYQIYYKKASSIAGLVGATATVLTDADNIYQGQTSSVYYDGKVWVFAAQPITSYAIKAWTTTDGLAWTEVNPGVSVDTPHQWAAVWDGKLVLAYCDAAYIKIKYTTDGSTWTQGVDVVNKEGMPRLFADDGALYCSHTTWGNPGEYWIYKLSGNLDTGDWLTTYNIHGGIGWYPCDPYLEKVGSDYLFFSADMLSDYSRQYIQVFKSSTVAGFVGMSEPKMVTNGGSASDASCDMWPVVVNASGSSYLFYTSERGTSPETVSGTGNIWYYEIDWNTDNDHFDYIQPAIDAANPDDTINVAAGTYDENPITINSSLTLLGAQANVEPVDGGRAGGESIVNGTINIYADDVIVNGFEIPNQHDAIMGRNNRALHQNVQMLYNYIHTNVAGAVGINLICDNPTVAVTTFKNYAISHNYINLSVSDRAAIGLNSNTPDINKNYVYDGLEISYNEITAPSAHGILISGPKEIYSLNNPVVAYNYIHDCWRGLFLINMTNADINNNNIEYCGTEAALIVVFGGTVADNILRSGDPIYANSYCLSLFGTYYGSAGSHDVSFTGNDIYYNGCSANPANGARVYSDDNDLSAIAFAHNNFYDGGANVDAVALKNYNAGTDLDAELNWWDDASGPYNALLNPDGLGGGVSDDVDFEPWLVAEWPSTNTAESKSETFDGDGTMEDTPTGGDVTIDATGNHTVTTAKYEGNPGSTPNFQSSGNYYDVNLDDDTGVNSLTISFCPAIEETVISYYNGTSWVQASDQTYSDGCIVVTITASTSPSLSDLTGTPFGSQGLPI